MSNEILFLIKTLVVLGLVVFFFSLGKVYLFVYIAILSVLVNVFVLKQYELFGFLTAGGNALYGAIFLSTDILVEHYGKKEATKALFIGFATNIIFVLATQVLINFTPAIQDFSQDKLEAIFSISPRILFGSLLAYGIAQSFDIYIFNWIKLKLPTYKWLWLRNNVSTMLSQFIDTVIFTFVGITTIGAIKGIIDPKDFWSIVFTAYIAKIFVSFIDTPFLYLSCWVKSKFTIK